MYLFSVIMIWCDQAWVCWDLKLAYIWLHQLTCDWTRIKSRSENDICSCEATQLQRKARKKPEASTGFEPMTSVTPVWCSTNWAKKLWRIKKLDFYWVLLIQFNYTETTNCLELILNICGKKQHTFKTFVFLLQRIDLTREIGNNYNTHAQTNHCISHMSYGWKTSVNSPCLQHIFLKLLDSLPWIIES